LEEKRGFMSIKVKVDTSGLEKFRKKVEAISGEQSLPLNELMPDSFMRKYTKFETLQSMVDAAEINSPEEFQSDRWNQFVAEHTQFANWQEMNQVAAVEWYKRKLS
jgi:hypothetical protein